MVICFVDEFLEILLVIILFLLLKSVVGGLRLRLFVVIDCDCGGGFIW